jgi:hypothetical protein
MKKTFHLEDERISLKRAKELLGAKRYPRVLAGARKRFLADPLTQIQFMTREGLLTIWFQVT